ncbi:hypothetical protein K457DRAFT_1832629 [Linnemannia elongata AG-77]|uniref:Uncharacterized protein n=1 Tax=Linnemannia elongata AG-77 TaxID=1314771 RepID=A0A197JXG9_9FUNG|nr:hypothetical protein K457DRAFT_1832629 [Linnemannia elongata AG-77]
MDFLLDGMQGQVKREKEKKGGGEEEGIEEEEKERNNRTGNNQQRKEEGGGERRGEIDWSDRVDLDWDKERRRLTNERYVGFNGGCCWRRSEESKERKKERK